ncbi:hypothetical protein K443DRAFT_551276 [Laccaria amethystina LaAM-08-1]|uniref:Uncharacterized protein n=1 Tax=Laccaria amethystina LaAM-08-1 TaxID=1095629 RepID=A0A0C9XJU5_9AGAR|nr:hypothetical protein K443DRAFT_551276 [Laccaria amethystina LaAM-08-1]
MHIRSPSYPLNWFLWDSIILHHRWLGGVGGVSTGMHRAHQKNCSRRQGCVQRLTGESEVGS